MTDRASRSSWPSEVVELLRVELLERALGKLFEPSQLDDPGEGHLDGLGH